MLKVLYYVMHVVHLSGSGSKRYVAINSICTIGASGVRFDGVVKVPDRKHFHLQSEFHVVLSFLPP